MFIVNVGLYKERAFARPKHHQTEIKLKKTIMHSIAYWERKKPLKSVCTIVQVVGRRQTSTTIYGIDRVVGIGMVNYF